MRIIKYLFLLFLLSLVALTIYIATQKGDFTVESSKVINSPKATVFNYVNDYKNWPKFSSWILSDPSVQPSFSPSTTGNGSSLTWEGNNEIGTIQTLYAKANDSIVQKMEFNETSSDVYWSFKDTVGGTKVTWKSVGKMDFMLKVSSFFNVGTKNTLSKIYDKSLVNLDKTLDFENSTYAVKINGIVKKLETFYLRQSFTSKISDISKNANAVFPKIIAFCQQNNISMNGKPFIIYQTYDTIKDLTRVSFCIPIKEQIFTSEGSDILAGKLTAFEALKTSLTGNYTYKNKALAETAAYGTAKNIKTGSTFSHLEIFTKGKNESLSPSKWLTEMYFPITPKAVTIPKVYKKVVKDSLAPQHNPKKQENEFDF
ncbi:SRPBCC family protein [Flavobacterium aquicola]|uniref:Polyketide cyclase/dehydrase/lipid transport protein n=1 Tax=Flavobacterium aquicola TaxID=1682742 RepID=A0A3E0EV87_9FLAO|nr:SRPBCC family protein [Flavobacterium aquicola]REH01734.1 polyketide cyclase/dehydrase/lipid transport protein [Flavobacterium aquicola]